MNTNDTVVIRNETYQIVDRVGSGGQGAVWKVKRASDGGIFALKVIDEKDPMKRREKIHNIQKWSNLGDKIVAAGKRHQVAHVFPRCYFVDRNTGDTGYIMDYVAGETLNKMLMAGKIEKLSVEQKLGLVKKVAACIKVLHDFGYCYTDINWGNFMWDEKTQTMYVIDCENVASRTEILEGKCAFLKGTGFFMAPEVAFDMEKAADNADRYALATLIFRLLTNNILQSAYHGKAMFTAVPACQSMDEVKEYEEDDDIDKNWRVFIFDERNKSNSIEDVFRDSTSPERKEFRKELDEVLAIWAKIDERIKELFYKAFKDPFDYNNRPSASLWVKVIDEVLGTKQKTPANPAVAPAPVKDLATAAAPAAGKAAGQAGRYPTFVPRGNAAPSSAGKYKPFVPRGKEDPSDDPE